MRGLLFTFGSAISLLVCVATVKLWLRSYGISDQFWWGRISHGPDGQDDSSFYLTSDRGGVCIARYGSRYPQDLLELAPNNRRPEGPYRGRRSWMSSGMYPYQGNRVGAPVAFRGAGFELTTGWRPNANDRYRRHTAALVVPFWAITLLTAIAPALFFLRLLRRRTLPAGARPCPRCKYDLRASSGRCPECGMPIEPEHASPKGPEIPGSQTA